ncbi:MAG: PEP-CTERM sorting domain-containing protein [Oscillatoriales cyanobacterium RM1_1_9]|nr:PEP-CTERM sorting domain-containing protein [Oscillatoriales cyanobacterium RM1_1_9]
MGRSAYVEYEQYTRKQVPTEVPEPGAIAGLMALGVLGSGSLLKRKS